MPTLRTLTGDLDDLLGGPNLPSAQVFVETNLPAGEALVDTTGKKIRLGKRAQVSMTGNSTSFSVQLPDTDSTDMNVEAGTLQFQVVVEFSGVNGRETWRSGWFFLTADSDLSDPGLVTTVTPVVADTAGALIAEMTTLRDETVEATGVPGAMALTDADAGSTFRVQQDARQAAAIASATADKVTKPARRAVALDNLPEFLNVERGYNTASWTQDNVTTVGNYRYVVYWAADKTPHIAQQNLTTGVWSTFNLGGVSGNPLASPVAGTDGHNTLAVGVDADGRIHVSGNHHNHALRYVRSTNPHDIAAWTAPGMIGTQENSVTYPTFVTLPDGTLLFAYRSGVSGDGDMLLNRYSTTTDTWTRLGTVIDGTASAESPYWNRLAVDDAGDLHVFFCWRGTGSADTNNDLCYVKLTGLTGALAAARGDGSAQALPVTHANAEKVIDTAASGSGLINSLGADVDAAGVPHTVAWQFDGAGKTQMMHVYRSGGAWMSTAVTRFNRAISMTSASDPARLARAQVACGPGGEVFIVYRADFDGLAGTVRCIDATGGPARSDFVLAHLPLGDWEPSLDSRALRDRGELVMLLAQSFGNYAALGYNVENVNYQWGGLLKVDLNQADLLMTGEARVPRLRVTAQHALPTTTISSTSLTEVGPSLPIPHGDPGKIKYARLTVRMRGGDATTQANARLLESTEAGATQYTGLVNVVGNAYVQIQTPWLPLRLLTAEAMRGWVNARVSRGAGVDGTITLGHFEVGVLDAD